MTAPRPEPAPLGATHLGEGRTRFLVWAPNADRVEVVLGDRVEPMTAVDRGYHHAELGDAHPGTRYRYRLHRPDGSSVDHYDPASRWQPDGVGGPSAVVERSFGWTDVGWRNRPLHEQVLYELHVGTFTPEGTFDAVITRLDDLVRLGVTTIELLPVGQFPGARNWGYDGVLWYAVQDSYGGPQGLRRLVDAAHAAGIGVVLDVVYNHVGPEGNHLADFGPYFHDAVPTPWGAAVNLDGPGSDAVRRFIVDNARRWITEFHVDGLRVDAVHALFDRSAVHILEAIATAVHDAARALGGGAIVIAESDLQDPRLVRPTAAGGLGLDAQWLDDVHHALHVAATGEGDGWYTDYAGLVDLWRALRDRYALAGRYSVHRDRTVGRPAPDVGFEHFVVCIQNHDQVGNRMHGDRLDPGLDRERRKAAAAAMLLGPFTPMLFMGEEYGEVAPFQFFVSYEGESLREAVRDGRRDEFGAFSWQGEAPDPNATETFTRSVLDWSSRDEGDHATLLRLYTTLLRLRRDHPALAHPSAAEPVATLHGPSTLSWVRETATSAVVVVLNLDVDAVTVALPPSGAWEVALDTASAEWSGPGAAATVAAPDGTGPTVTVGPERAVLAVRRSG